MAIGSWKIIPYEASIVIGNLYCVNVAYWFKLSLVNMAV